MSAAVSGSRTIIKLAASRIFSIARVEETGYSFGRVATTLRRDNLIGM